MKGTETERHDAVGPPRAAARSFGSFAPFVLILACLAAFSGSVGNQLVDWDDLPNLVANDAYHGLGLENLRWMFTTSHGGHYQPLTWVSFAVDYLLWGVSAAGFHFTNLVLHVVTALGVMAVARRLVAAARPDLGPGALTFGALAAALLFAVHPLRVESVAWATERRDVLSGAWLVWAVWCYLRFVGVVQGGDASGVGAFEVGSPRGLKSAARWVWFVAALGCYVLSLLSKATGMTLPAVLLLLDAYPLRRWGLGEPGEDRSRQSHRLKTGGTPERHRLETGATQKMDGSKTGIAGVRAEKIAFAVPAVGIAVVAVIAQRAAGAMWGLGEHPLSLRIAQALYGVAFYVWKTLVPIGLVPLYEQPPNASATDWPYGAAMIVAFIVSIAALLVPRRYPAVMVVWLAYLVLIAPMLGFAQSGPQVVADRYSYIACIPFAVLAGGWLAAMWNRAKARHTGVRRWLAGGLAAVCGVLIVMTRAQVSVWADSYTLWTTVIERAPDTGLAHANLAHVLLARGKVEDARAHARRALEILPGNRAAHFALAEALLALGDPTTAATHYQTSLEISRNLGRRDAASMRGLAAALVASGDLEAASSLYRQLTELEPGIAEWAYRLGSVEAQRGRFAEATAQFERAIAADSSFGDAYFRLGRTYAEQGDPRRAVAAWERGLRAAPDDVDLMTRVAWAMATSADAAMRDGARAVALARRAVELSGGRSVRAREALAAGLGEVGEFAEAVRGVEGLLRDNSLALNEEQRARIEEQLERYRGGAAVRE